MSQAPHETEHEDGLPSYLNRLTRAPLLTAEEEVHLTRAVQQGDQVAKQRLIESNMRLVINVAKTYRNRTIPLEDLIQEGAIGLMQAAERFDPDKGYRFSTYATHWIRQSIGRAIDNKSKAIRLPAHISQSLRKVERVRADLSRQLGQEPTLEQVAAAVGLTPKRLATIMQSAQETLSLDMSVGDGAGTTLGGIISDPNCVDAEEQVIDDEMFAELNRILDELNERERMVMRLRYSVDHRGAEMQQQEVVAQELKISRERVRQIEIQAIKKLRVLAQRRRLKDILGK